MLSSDFTLAQRPIVIAHRGASGYLPEHTLPAVALAYGMGADYIEQDLVLSKDSVPVVLHDIHIDTVTDVASKFPNRARKDGRFYAIDFTLAELKTLHVNERIDPKSKKRVYPKRFPSNRSVFRIPTLAEEIELVQGLNDSTGKKIGIYPEIKNPAWHRQQGFDISPVVVAELKKYGYKSKEDPCFLQCFDTGEVKRIRNELGVNLQLVQLLSKQPSEAELKDISGFADGIGPPLSAAFSFGDSPQPTRLIALAHKHNLTVHPYTFRVDGLPKGIRSFRELVDRFVQADVDGMFTDFPDQCIEIVKQ